MRKEVPMKTKSIVKKWKNSLAALMVPVLLAGVLVTPVLSLTDLITSAKTENPFSIRELEGFSPDYEKYLNNSVMFPLPSGIKDSEEISVIVTVDTISMMDAYERSGKTMSFTEYITQSEDAKGIKASIAAEKSDVLSNLDEKGISYRLGEEYSTVVSGFEILIKAGDFATTCSVLGKGRGVIVGEVYNAAETQLVENEVDVFDTGIFDSSDAGYDGTGMVVAVLDTGLDSKHTAFSPDNFTSKHLGLTYDDVAALVQQTTAYDILKGITVDDVYINEKVPFGFDYADNDSDVYSTHNNHGTHVSGVIVGNDDTIRGVAPNAQLVSMKIFSDVMDSTRTAWVMAALEDCVILGVDVINMSIGTSCGFSRETDEEAVNGIYEKIRKAGISLIVAASNSYSSSYGSESNGNLGLTSNPDTGTVGSPSTYEGAMSVASISGVETPYIKYGETIVYFVESVNSSSKENSFFDVLLGDKDSAELEFVLVPGVGRSADYTGLDVKGKIALVRRGSNTFEEKAIIAQEQGAAGIIIYNNVSGDIKMNVGEATLAVCSISQDDGEMLAAVGRGKLVIGRSQTSGPFISDFSAWGPTPDLRIKPEITAHGGSILSAITGGGYDRLSGTSMACPNLAGVVVLLRQYVMEKFPSIANDNNQVNAMVNSLLMSTADIAFGKNGLPYAVRKQGAGLGSLSNALNTPAYLTTYDRNGKQMDKAKLELGDDPSKTGVYEMTFAINNFGNATVSYDIGAYVMTEGVSDTKTSAGKTTVTEESFLLEGATITIVSVSGGTQNGNNVSVSAGGKADVKVKITLSNEDKAYLNKSFENGMYVEGFVTLTATAGTEYDLNVPYLAFYGDWTVAPLFDLTYYDTNADELDDGIDFEDKTMADAYPTRPIGGVSDDYVSYLGTYYFLQDPADMVIAANQEYIALSNMDGTIHSLRFVWAGMLRNAAKIEVSISNAVTGEVVFTCVDDMVRKSYSDGGPSIYPSNIEIEFDTADYNFANNSRYIVKLVGYLDYGDGALKTNKNNVFEFPLNIDFQAPAVTDVEYYYEYDKTLKKNRLYADVLIYDNHYAMSAQLGYVTTGEDENGNPTPEMKTFEQYMTPVYSQKNSTTRVTFELTDYIFDIKNNATNKNTFVVSVYDYALNSATYEIPLPDDFTEFYFESLEDGLTLSPNEVYALEPIVYPYTQWSELLNYSSSKPSVVRVVNNKLVAISSGTAIIKAQDPNTNESVTFKVTVLKEGDEGYQRFDKPVVDVFTLDGYTTLKAYYMVNSSDKDIGDTGNVRFFEGNFNLSMYPSESVLLQYSLDPFFPGDTTVEFESGNEKIVKIDANGIVTAVGEGFSSVTIKVMQEGKSTYYSETVSVEVKDPYVKAGSSLSHYYGNGGLVDIPAKLALTEIGQFAFSNFEYIMKTDEELAFDDAEKSKAWFIGDNTITKVVIPEGVERISSYAFANLTALEEVVLPSTLESIDYGAFYNCVSLKKITFSGKNNLKIINQNAFENCDLRGTLSLEAICVISDYAFAGNKNLSGIILADTLQSVGQYAFAGCKAMKTADIKADKVKYGAYAFTGCESLKEFRVNSAVLPEGMFYQCKAMETVTIGPEVNDVGAFAFRETKIGSFVVEKGNRTYKGQTADHILSADGKTLIALSPNVSGEYANATVTTVGKGALSHNKKITSAVMEKVTMVADYGFASSTNLVTVKLGKLTSIGKYGFFETHLTSLPAFADNAFMGDYAFSHTALKSVTIPDDMVVGEGVFSECLNLSTVVIGDDVVLGDYAFSVNKDNAFEVESFYIGEEKYFRYKFSSALTSLTIGDNVVIGNNAFSYAASLEKVTLGKNAVIGNMAFYNAASLKQIDLSKAKSIGDYALSGDVYYACLDTNMTVAAVGKDGYYIYSYYGPKVTSLDVSSAESIGKYAFAYCRDMVEIKLGSAIKEIPAYAFAGCAALKKIDLKSVEIIGEYAFMECGLESVDLSGAATIDQYAFVSNRLMESLVLNPNGSTVGEGAFAYCDPLCEIKNLSAVTEIGDYAFAYIALTEADLSGVISLGSYAFIKEEVTPFKVTLGNALNKLGDNPFAMCIVAPFASTVTETVGNKEREVVTYNFDLSDAVSVIDGSLYYKNALGLELVTYTGMAPEDVVVADGTVRISAYAFAGSNVQRVKMPYMTIAIGHKAFYACEDLDLVVFGSYNVPIFEEEFDPTYYESLEHVPGAGEYGEYVDYDGTEVTISGMGLIPYFMWNATGGQYSNVFYGANFVDYVGYLDNKIIMVSPVNGVGYDSFICDAYFGYRIEGPAAPDDVTIAAINAINAIPEKVTYEDRAIVEAAREAYNKIATLEQQALVTNYNVLVSAEQRIAALTPPSEEIPGDDIGASMGNPEEVLLLFSLLAVFVLAIYCLQGVLKKEEPATAGPAQ